MTPKQIFLQKDKKEKEKEENHIGDMWCNYFFSFLFFFSLNFYKKPDQKIFLVLRVVWKATSKNKKNHGSKMQWELNSRKSSGRGCQCKKSIENNTKCEDKNKYVKLIKNRNGQPNWLMIFYCRPVMKSHIYSQKQPNW